jgi:hypothetical protein
VIAPLQWSISFGFKLLPGRCRLLEMEQVHLILGNGSVGFIVEAHSAKHNVWGFMSDGGQCITGPTGWNRLSLLFNLFPD